MARHAVQRFARYRVDGRIHHGRMDGEEFVRWRNPPWEGSGETRVRDRIASVRLLPPVVPTKIVCVGLNYRAHIAESKTILLGAGGPDVPLIFLKPPSALIASGEAIRYPAGVSRLDPEAELAVVIGRRTRSVVPGEAHRFVAGLSCFNDVSARDFQYRDGQWTRAKGFDTFAPLGPWIAVGLPPEGLQVECRVNGQTRQRGNTRDLLFSVPVLVSHISRIMTLEPGDVIATGTPAGVAPVAVGDRVEIEVEGVGILENRVEGTSE